MLTIKLIVVFLMVFILGAAGAHQCHECLNFASCSDEQNNRVVDCNNSTSQYMVDLSKIHFPNLTSALVYSGKFQCVSFEFTPQGAPIAVIMFKGCMFETNQPFCDLTSTFGNGRSHCRACNTDKCNSGVALGWSMVLTVASLIVSSWGRGE